MRASIWRVALVVVMGVVWGSPAGAAEYVLGAEDEINVSVWLHPELERKLAIGRDGTIIFPPLGEVQAAGLTTRQLGERLADRLSTYLRQTTTVTVTVDRFMSRSVYVTGSVAAPGRYGFEVLPGLPDVLSAAGGAMSDADLTQVQVVRREGAGRRTMTVDVSAALRDTLGGGLPDLLPGDQILVPGRIGMGGTAGTDAVTVLGSVRQPGNYPVGSGMLLSSLLAQAGGPMDGAKLHRISVQSFGPNGQQVTRVNMQASLENGEALPPIIKPGDVVYVPPPGTLAGRAFSATLQLMAGLASFIVIADWVRDQ
jgi:protein involved in polysaccharide export with SLBB domain